MFHKKPVFVVLSVLLHLALAFGQANSTQDNQMRVGVGESDITGPSYGVNFMGYGQLTESGRGIHLRLHARATIIEDTLLNHRIVYVVADLNSISEAIKLEVVNRLQALYGSKYNDGNVMLTATHTHAAPGGYFASSFYNNSSLGFNNANYQTVVAGIVSAISQAQEDLEPASIILNEGNLLDATVNRSPLAYAADPDKSQYATDTDKRMLQIKFKTVSGRFKGVLNWFAVHGTSMSNKNRLISSDNKGVAAELLEKVMSQQPGGKAKFVASFANADAGDSSPNIFDKPGHRSDLDDFQRTQIVGTKQYQRALELLYDKGETLFGPIDYRHLWIKLSAFRQLCHGAYGYSFAAGASLDGPSGVAGFDEGMRIDQILHLPVLTKIEINLGKRIGLTGSGVDESCHFPKRVLFPVGSHNPPTISDILPFQIFRIGTVAIISIPGELTTMAGRRLESHVLGMLAPYGVTRVVVGAYANAYRGYITTPEEYQLQRYEGGANLFGGESLNVYQQIYGDLAGQIVGQKGSLSGGPRPKLAIQKPLMIFNLHRPVHVNSKNRGEKFGDILTPPNPFYKKGETVHVVFRAAYNEDPSYFINPYVEVQLFDGTSFKTVSTDGTLGSILRWGKDRRSPHLHLEFFWYVPSDAAPGSYRIVHHGKLSAQPPLDYKGISKTFKIE